MTFLSIDDLVTHPDSGTFWQGIQQREFRLQFCSDCSQARYYPRIVCPSCGSTDFRWRSASQTGEVYSVTTVRRPIGDLPAPYQVALVDLDVGVRFLAAVQQNSIVSIGDRIRVGFRTRDDGAVMPELQPE